MPLETFMRQVLKDRALDFTIKARTIVISEVLPETINGTPSPSFDIALEKVSGTVLNGQQQPLEGVTVTS